MAARKKTTDVATAVEDPFADLLATATVEDRRAGAAPKKIHLNEDEIPANYFEVVENLYKSKERLRLKVTDGDAFKKLGRLFRSAAHHRGYSATVRGLYDGEGEDALLIGMSMTVGDKRGSKSTDSENVGD